MNRPLHLALFLSLLFGFTCSPCEGAEWYADAAYVNEDAYGFSRTFAGAVGDMFKKGARVEGHSHTGKLYCVMGKKEYDQIIAAGDKGVVWSTHNITHSNAPTYRKFFIEKGEGIKIPYWLSLGSGVLGLSGKLPYVAAAATIATMAAELINLGATGHLEKATDLATKIEAGDRFVRRCAIIPREGMPYAHVVDSLVICDGGQDKGEVMLSRFIYAVKVE